MKQEYYTENRKIVTEYVESNRTLFIEDLNEAIKTSLSFKTYHSKCLTKKWNLLDMECREIRIRQLKSQSSQLRKSLKLYNDLPNAQNRILEEIKLNEEIIKFLEI